MIGRVATHAKQGNEYDSVDDEDDTEEPAVESEDLVTEVARVVPLCLLR